MPAQRRRAQALIDNMSPARRDRHAAGAAGARRLLHALGAGAEAGGAAGPAPPSRTRRARRVSSTGRSRSPARDAAGAVPELPLGTWRSLAQYVTSLARADQPSCRFGPVPDARSRPARPSGVDRPEHRRRQPSDAPACAPVRSATVSAGPAPSRVASAARARSDSPGSALRGEASTIPSATSSA